MLRIQEVVRIMSMAFIPTWAGLLGWSLLLLGFLLQRRALRIQINAGHGAMNIGAGNSINQSGDIDVQPLPPIESDLSRWGSWSSIVGLALTVWPLIKHMLSG